MNHKITALFFKDIACTRRGFTLAELTVAMLLVGLVILTATSAEFTSRQFFNAAEEKIYVQDEAKVAMLHIANNLRRGIGDITNPGYTLYGPTNRIRVQIDGLTGAANGVYGDAVDGEIEYEFDTVNFVVVFDPNADDSVVGDKIDITDDIIVDGSFQTGTSLNEVLVTIVARRDPSRAASLENPEITLTSRIVLRAMSCK